MNQFTFKTKRFKTFAKMATSAAFVFLTGISSSSAQVTTPIPLDLSDIPLFLQGSTPPAVALSFDTSPGTRNAYIFNVDGLILNSGSLPGGKFFLAAPKVNALYYQPDYQYQLPLTHTGAEFNAGRQTSFGAAYINGFDPLSATINLACQYRVITKFNANGSQGFYGSETPDCDSSTDDPERRAFYMEYTKPSVADSLGLIDDILNNDNYALKPIIDIAATPFNDLENFAIWFSYYKSRNMLIRSSATIAFHKLADEANIKLAWQSFKSNAAFEVDMMPLNDPIHKKAFWDWLFGLKPGGADALKQATIEAGELFSRPQAYREDGVGEMLSCQQNFHIILANAKANGSGSISLDINDDAAGSVYIPLGSTAASGGVRYTGTGESAIYHDPEENKSFADITFDYWAKDLMPESTYPTMKDEVPRYLSSLKNANGDSVSPGVGQDLWDAGDINNTDAQAIYWNDKNDPANWQHMVNFVVGLGIQGRLERNEDKYEVGEYREGDVLDYTNLRNDTLQWDTLENGNDKAKFVDNLWHGAINSRGDYIQATTPEELINAFTALIEQLLTRRTGSSSASTVSANIVTNDTKTFKTGFDAIDWSGTVVAQTINLDGTIGDVLWDAACNLTGGKCGSLAGTIVDQYKSPANRNIITYNKFTGNTSAFFASSLELNQQVALNQSSLIGSVVGATTITLDHLVDYLRGDRTYEEQNGGVFRNRRVLLGDVIHSSAVVVRGPSESYVEKFAPGYTQFKSDNKLRKNVVLVGANDGMLHAFDVENGNELWAFIPSQSLANMHLLADPAYGHQNYVDASPSVRDIQKANGTWMTVAVGGLRLGGQGYYALDITNPLDPKVLWEFTDDSTGGKGDSDMGYSYGDAFISRIDTGSTTVAPLNESVDGKWVAFLPNGYNNVIDDGHSGSGTSVLYMVDMETGIKLKEYDTGQGQVDRTNGMAAPVVSDVPYSLNGDAVFVGDLRGDVYRIDLTKAKSGTYPDAELMIKAIDPYKTPITIPLRLTQRQIFSPDPTDVMVNLGTGKFIENGDRSSLSTDSQYVAAVFDQEALGSYPIDLIGDSSVVVQVATDDINTNTRTITQLPVSKGLDTGWVMLLPGEGERVIAKMATRASAYFLIYSSFLPLSGSACATGGASYVSVVDSRTGGSPVDGPILNNGTVDGIYVENQVFGVTPIGFAGGGGEILIISTDSGAADGGDVSIVIPDFTWRRRSWHRMFSDG